MDHSCGVRLILGEVKQVYMMWGFRGFVNIMSRGPKAPQGENKVIINRIK